MKRSLGIFMVLALMVASMHGLINGAVAQDATPTIDPALVEMDPISPEDCEGVTEYARILVTLGATIAAASYGLPSAQVADWTDEAYTQFISALTWAIEQLTGVTAPEAAEKLNEYAIVAIQTIQGAIVFIRTTGIAAELPFMDQLEQVDELLGTVITTLEQACPGRTEGLATPVASPAAA